VTRVESSLSVKNVTRVELSHRFSQRDSSRVTKNRDSIRVESLTRVTLSLACGQCNQSALGFGVYQRLHLSYFLLESYQWSLFLDTVWSSFFFQKQLFWTKSVSVLKLFSVSVAGVSYSIASCHCCYFFTVFFLFYLWFCGFY